MNIFKIKKRYKNTVLLRLAILSIITASRAAYSFKADYIKTPIYGGIFCYHNVNNFNFVLVYL